MLFKIFFINRLEASKKFRCQKILIQNLTYEASLEIVVIIQRSLVCRRAHLRN